MDTVNLFRSIKAIVSSWAVGVCSILLLGVLCAGGAGAEPPSKDDIAYAIKLLGDNDYKTRERATKFLRSAGKAAEPALREAAKSSDPEVALRARQILRDLAFGIGPDTPEEIRQLLLSYRDGDQHARRGIVGQLAEKGDEGISLLLRLVEVEEDETVRREIATRIQNKARRLLADGDVLAAEALLEKAAASGEQQPIQDYAVFLLLRDKLDEKIPRLLSQQKESPSPATAKLLAHLYRARGDLRKAKTAAQESGDQRLLRAILHEMEDWRELAATRDGGDEIDKLGVLAAYHRLAGNAKEFDETIKRIREFADKNRREPGLIKRAASALLLNGRPQEGVTVLVESKLYLPAVQVLRSQLRFREAIELVEKAQTEDDEERFDLGVNLAAMWGALGEKERASEIFSQLAERQKARGFESPPHWLLFMERQVGLPELAFEHCALFLEGNQDGGLMQRLLLGSLFCRPDKRSEIFLGKWSERFVSCEADMWWSILRKKFPDENLKATLNRVRAQMQAKTLTDEWRALAKEAEELLAEPAPGVNSEWLCALGEAYHRMGLHDLAGVWLEKFAERTEASGQSSDWAWVIAGDSFAEHKRWKEAVECYEHALRKDKTQAAAVYRLGWARAQVGEKQEGERLMESAVLLPLAADSSRLELANTIAKLGQMDAARRQCEIILRASVVGERLLSYGAYYATENLLEYNEFLAAAKHYERHIIDCLRMDESGHRVHGEQTDADLIDSVLVHQWRVRGYAAAGQVDKMLEAARACQAIAPGDIEAPLCAVPVLDATGRRKEADEIFSTAFGFLRNICSDYPRSARYHHEAALLAIRCRRQLGQALAHALKAVELGPDNPVYLSTLAEIHAQRGERQQAIELWRRCIKLDPENESYRKHLDEFVPPSP